jgi:dolichol-phosphate mannosyltransferase
VPTPVHASLSVIVPAHNEAASIRATVESIVDTLHREHVDYEVLVVDDASTDDTAQIIRSLGTENPRVRYHLSHNPRGFGFTVRAGLDVFRGDVVAIVMADGSDDPEDLIRYLAVIQDGFDCAFGSRFIRGSTVEDYPRVKLLINRFVNWALRIAFRSRYNDTTNAFKAYRREVIETVQPLLSNHFNLTVEIPLKAIVRGHSYAVVPISWRNRTSGDSKLSLNEMGSRYAFIVLYVLLERHLSRGDYRRSVVEAEEPGRTSSGMRVGRR